MTPLRLCPDRKPYFVGGRHAGIDRNGLTSRNSRIAKGIVQHDRRVRDVLAIFYRQPNAADVGSHQQCIVYAHRPATRVAKVRRDFLSVSTGIIYCIIWVYYQFSLRLIRKITRQLLFLLIVQVSRGSVLANSVKFCVGSVCSLSCFGNFSRVALFCGLLLLPTEFVMAMPIGVGQSLAYHHDQKQNYPSHFKEIVEFGCDISGTPTRQITRNGDDDYLPFVISVGAAFMAGLKIGRWRLIRR
jgi:hypothetical protein